MAGAGDGSASPGAAARVLVLGTSRGDTRGRAGAEPAKAGPGVIGTRAGSVVTRGGSSGSGCSGAGATGWSTADGDTGCAGAVDSARFGDGVAVRARWAPITRAAATPTSSIGRPFMRGERRAVGRGDAASSNLACGGSAASCGSISHGTTRFTPRSADGVGTAVTVGRACAEGRGGGGAATRGAGGDHGTGSGSGVAAKGSGIVTTGRSRSTSCCIATTGEGTGAGIVRGGSAADVGCWIGVGRDTGVGSGRGTGFCSGRDTGFGSGAGAMLLGSVRGEGGVEGRGAGFPGDGCAALAAGISNALL